MQLNVPLSIFYTCITKLHSFIILPLRLLSIPCLYPDYYTTHVNFVSLLYLPPICTESNFMHYKIVSRHLYCIELVSISGISPIMFRLPKSLFLVHLHMLHVLLLTEGPFAGIEFRAFACVLFQFHSLYVRKNKLKVN